jgi:hypothetical protein
MQTEREFTLQEVSSLTAIPGDTLKAWTTAGLLKPVRLGKQHGLGRAAKFDFRGIMAAALLETLRKKGAILNFAAPIARFVCQQPAEAIKQAADDDLLIVAAGEVCPPCFKRRDEQIHNKTGIVELAFAASVRDLWDRIEKGIEVWDAQRLTAAN